MKWFLIFCLLLCCGFKFPDKGGITNFDHPEKVNNGIFILSNPRSGSHLLFASITKLTQSPIRTRLPLWYYLNDSPYREPENVLNLPLDFEKPTVYWNHEYCTLLKLNHSNNKLIFTLRNYKENILSILNIKYQTSNKNVSLERYLIKEILNNGMIFYEYIVRLKRYHQWNPSKRLLIHFEDLVSHPSNFAPHLLSFLEGDTECDDFINNYASFKSRVRAYYDTKPSPTVSKNNVHYFSKYISPRTHRLLDQFVKTKYPILWDLYLQAFEFKD